MNESIRIKGIPTGCNVYSNVMLRKGDDAGGIALTQFIISVFDERQFRFKGIPTGCNVYSNVMLRKRDDADGIAPV